MESLAQFFSSGFADWGLGIAFVAVCALLLARLRLRLPHVTANAATSVVVEGVPELVPIPSRDSADPISLSDMQARAAFQIDAAEHALNRLLAECAPIAAVSVNPTVTARRELPEPIEKRDRSSIAA